MAGVTWCRQGREQGETCEPQGFNSQGGPEAWGHAGAGGALRVGPLESCAGATLIPASTWQVLVLFTYMEKLVAKA